MPEILNKILTCTYGELFKRSKDDIEAKYRAYAKKVHPDVNKDPKAEEAFRRLTELKDEALKALTDGSWHEKGVISFKLDNGFTLRIRYKYHRILDICEYYISKTRLIYIFDEAYKRFYENFRHIFASWKCSDAKMKKEIFDVVIPQDIHYYTSGDKYIISIQKTEDVYPLRALIDNYWYGKVPGRHLAWITSRLMQNITFINHEGYTVNGIDIDNCFVSCKYHAISIYGGWWFATKEGEPMIGTTSGIYAVMPPKVKADKVSNYLTDIESVKLMLRSLDTDCPKAMTDFYMSGSSENPIEEWKKWDEALKVAYGERKFIKLEPKENEIYPKEE